MPRNYKKPLGSRPYKNYTEKKVQQAVSVIKNGRLTSRQASEISLVDVLIASAEFGCPHLMIDLRIVLKSYLDKEGIYIKKFSNNMPGEDWSGIYPLNRYEVLKTMPQKKIEETGNKIDDALLSYLKDMRSPSTSTTVKKKMIQVKPGKSTEMDLQKIQTDTDLTDLQHEDITDEDSLTEEKYVIIQLLGKKCAKHFVTEILSKDEENFYETHLRKLQVLQNKITELQ
ncbi:hypothetical protein RN001_004149 [Aquatica leii]|uniref:Uncharacterized protein n=1 Tax=Aquatica leii TaxID=1421715 RepID=A0AAN7SRU2_9COLE|nr:hypothetical protein RN001_004149 [Aquatica leii]